MDKERAFHLYVQVIAARQRVPAGELARGLAKGCVQAVEDFDAGCDELKSERDGAKAAAEAIQKGKK